MRKYFIVVAGGKGLRMGRNIPKQFVVLGGKPVLMHTLERLHLCEPSAEMILVVPQAHESYWRELVEEYHFDMDVTVAYGGDTRYQSVKNGLACIAGEEDALVAVHDGVRPFVSPRVVRDCFETAMREEACIPAIRPVESVRWRVRDGGTEPLDRDKCLLVQTPQVFRADILKRAYARKPMESFTDDASVVEADGGKIAVVEGNRENIKLTTPFDLLVARALMENPTGC